MLPGILYSRVPSTTEEFYFLVANEDFAFVWSLFATDMQALFVYAYRTLFKAKSIVFMVAASHNDLLGYEDFSKERDKLKERCEVL